MYKCSKFNSVVLHEGQICLYKRMISRYMFETQLSISQTKNNECLIENKHVFIQLLDELQTDMVKLQNLL